MATYGALTDRPSWGYLAAANLITGVTRIASLGNNSDIDTLDQPEDIWSGASLGVLNGIDHKLIQLPQSEVLMEIVSDNANDSAAGTGARTVLITYLNNNWLQQTTTRTMNGTTPVLLPIAVRRIVSVITLTVGTYGGTNIGAISVRAQGGLGATYSYMQPAIGLAKSSLISVPDGKSLDLITAITSISRTDTNGRWGDFSLVIMNESGRIIKGLAWSNNADQPYIHGGQDRPFNTVVARTDAWIRCDASSGSNTNVTGILFGLLR